MKTILSIQNQGQGLQVENISHLMRVKLIEMDTSLKYKSVLRAKKSNWKNSDFWHYACFGHLLELKDNEVLMVKTTHNFVRQTTITPLKTNFSPKLEHINIMKMLLLALVESEIILHKLHGM